ncbi:MAG: response regulator transcription factor [Ignavibacteria bacterium]|nr:response regulator transcription factor [Ignavibacteria bacterium]
MDQQKIRAMIVDDESGIRTLLRTLLTRYFSGRVEVVAEADGVESALETIRASQAQLLFLDVDLQDGMGFEVLDLLGEERKKVHVIFITSHGEKFMHRAMRRDAVDYLNKPIDPSEFTIGVERGIAHVLESRAIEQHSTSPATKRSTMLCIRHNTGTETIVAVNMIICCKADSNYTQIYLTDKRPITASKTLKHYEEVLVKYGFVRVSRNLLINPAHCHVKLDKKNTAVVQMPDGSHEQVDPAFQESVKKEFLEILE